MKKKKKEKKFRSDSNGIRKGETKVWPKKKQNSGDTPVTLSCAKWRVLNQNLIWFFNIVF